MIHVWTLRGLSCEFYVEKCYSHSSYMLTMTSMTSLFDFFLGVFIEIYLYVNAIMPSCEPYILPLQVLASLFQDKILENNYLGLEILTLLEGKLYKLVSSYARTIGWIAVFLPANTQAKFRKTLRIKLVILFLKMKWKNQVLKMYFLGLYDDHGLCKIANVNKMWMNNWPWIYPWEL